MRVFAILLAGCALAIAQDQTSAPQPEIRPKPPRRDCSVEGTVVNRVTREPVPRARVTVGSDSTTADNSGHWSLTGRLPNGRNFRRAVRLRR